MNCVIIGMLLFFDKKFSLGFQLNIFFIQMPKQGNAPKFFRLHLILFVCDRFG